MLFRSSNETGNIYFLFQDRELVYVGKSKVLLQRISTHRREKVFSSVRYITVNRDVLDQCEIAFIKYFRPPLNKTKHSAITPAEHQLIAKYVRGDLSILSAEPPTTWGPVAFYLDESWGIVPFASLHKRPKAKLVFGYYDDDGDGTDHTDECFNVDDDELDRDDDDPGCDCEPFAIVYLAGDRTGYYVTSRKNLYDIDVKDAADGSHFSNWFEASKDDPTTMYVAQMDGMFAIEETESNDCCKNPDS